MSYIFKKLDKVYCIKIGKETITDLTRTQLEMLRRDIEVEMLDEDYDEHGNYIGGNRGQR
jgi:hypothetical protein